MKTHCSNQLVLGLAMLLAPASALQISCDDTESAFEGVFDNSVPVQTLHPPEHDHDHRLLQTPEDTFLGCNDTHFDVYRNEHIYTYEIDIFRYTVEGECTAEDPASPENCYFTYCEVTDDHDDHDHDDGDDHDDHDHGDEDDHDEHDDGEGDDHDHDDEDDFIDSNSMYYQEGYYLSVGHAEECCVDVTLGTHAHHTCGLDSVLLGLDGDEEEDHSDHDHNRSRSLMVLGCEETVTLWDQLVANTEATNVLHGTPHKSSQEDVFTFLGCNQSTFDLYLNDHIYTYEIASLKFEEEGDCGDNTTASNCYFSVCVAGEMADDHDDHEEGADHEEGEGDFVDSNEDYYLEGHYVTVGHTQECCVDVTLNTEAHHSCAVDSILEPYMAGNHSEEDHDDHNRSSLLQTCDQTAVQFGETLDAATPVGILHPTEHRLALLKQDNETSESEYLFLGCNYSTFDVLKPDEHIYTYELASLKFETPGECAGNGTASNCYFAHCVAGEGDHDDHDHEEEEGDDHDHEGEEGEDHEHEDGDEHEDEEDDHEHEEGDEHDHEDEEDDHDDHDHEDGDDHDHDDEEGSFLDSNAAYYKSGGNLKVGHVGECCVAVDFASVEAHHSCAVTNVIGELVEDGDDPEEVPVDTSSPTTIIAVGVVAVVGLGLVAFAFFVPSETKKTPESAEEKKQELEVKADIKPSV